MRLFFMMALLATGAAFGQVNRRPYVRTTGEGVVSVRPDQARITVGVVTQGTTAAEATDANSTKATAVLAALRSLLGPNADIRTTSFFVSPITRVPQPGGQATIVGYTATNQFLVTIADLATAGRVIDAATVAGANTVGGISFSLRDTQPAHQQALRSATQQARNNAEAIASGLGGRLGSVISAEEGAVARIGGLPSLGADAGRAVVPVEVGNLEVRATVTMEFDLLQ